MNTQTKKIALKIGNDQKIQDGETTLYKFFGLSLYSTEGKPEQIDYTYSTASGSTYGSFYYPQGERPPLMEIAKFVLDFLR